MKAKIKKIYRSIYQRYVFYRRTIAFRKRYRNISSELFVDSIGKADVDKYITKWKVFGESVETDTLTLSYNLSSILDLNIVPENLFSVLIEPKLNRYHEASFFEIKNIYNKWFANDFFPDIYLHKIDGVYYNENFVKIIDPVGEITHLNVQFPLIVKSSRDTFGGKDVNIVNSNEELAMSLNKYDFLVCQEMLKQNDFLEQINKSSINTVRTCLYRTMGGEFVVLNNSIRFGVNGSLDNETSGGIVCNIDEDGNFNEYAVDKYAKKYFSHPNSGVVFKDNSIPFFQDLNATAVMVANEIPFCRLISLDMSLDRSNKWRCLEINLFGQTIRFSQYAGKSFFGKYTDEVIQYVVNLD